jgi:hypothetical protein
VGKYCTNCGNELHTGARFCAKCGAAVYTGPAKTTSTAQPKSMPQSQPQPQPQPKLQSQPQPQPQPKLQPQPQPKPVSQFRPSSVLCIVLSVLLLIQITAVALYGWPGFLVGNGVKPPSVLKSDSFTLEEGQTTVSTDSGVKVEFGPYNAMDGEEVTVKELSADSISIEGGTRKAYDISAGERTEFDGLLGITLPYDERETDSADEEGSVFAEYFNPETGEWELVDYTVNTADNTITITTDHLSQYCTVTVQDAGTPYAILSKFSNKRLDNEKALAILQEFETSGKPGDVGNSFLSDLYSRHIPSVMHPYFGDAEAGAFHDVLGWLTDIFELSAEGLGYREAARVYELNGYLLLGISTVSLASTFSEAYRGNESAEAVAAEAYKLTYNIGLAWLDFKRVTTGMVQISMLGVIALDYSLNKFMMAADQTYKDALYKVVTAYNEKVHPWTKEEWYTRIMGLYNTRGDDPERFNAALRGIMENFSSRYFYDNPEEQLVATNEAGLHAYTTGILPETEAAKQYCIEQYMVRLGEYLQSVLEDVMKKIQYDNRKAYNKNATELRKALNAPLILEIKEEVPDGEKSKYAGCIVDICRPDAPVDKDWSVALDMYGRATINATVFGYIQAGIPTEIRLWDKDDLKKENGPILTQTFKVTEKNTIIPLTPQESDYDFYLVERYNYDYRYLYYDGYAYQIMAVKRDMEANQVTEHLINGIESEVEQDIYREYIYDPSTGLLTWTEDLHYTELKPNADWTALRGYRKYPEYLPGSAGREDSLTGEYGYEYVRFLAVTWLSPGKWQVKETGETIQYVLNSYDSSDNQTKRLESPSGQSFLTEARSFAADIGKDMYDGQGYD